MGCMQYRHREMRCGQKCRDSVDIKSCKSARERNRAASSGHQTRVPCGSDKNKIRVTNKSYMKKRKGDGGEGQGNRKES